MAEPFDSIMNNLRRQDLSPSLYLCMSDTLAREGRRREAVLTLKRGLGDFPESVEIGLALGRVLLENGDPEEAKKVLKRAPLLWRR